MDRKFYVSLEAARLLKDKGYNEYCISYYQDNCREIYYSFCGERNSNWEERCVSAPSKAEAIDWLESKGIVVETYFYRNGQWGFTTTRGDFEIYDSWCYDELIFPTRLEAEDAAIIKALELISKKGE